MEDVAPSRLDRGVLAVERRLGRAGTAAAVGAVGLALACVAVAPGVVPQKLGQFYAQSYAWLSLDPFVNASQNPVAFRPLTPLISWAVGLRGSRLLFTNLTLAALLLSCVFAWFRRRAPRPGDALLAAAVFCFSFLTLGTVFSPYYCDALTYLVIFAMACARGRPLVFYALFAVGLFNRESLVFVVPWFAFLELWDSLRRVRTLATQSLCYSVALAPYLFFRAWMAARAPMALGVEDYLAPLAADPLHFFRQTARFQWAGLYSIFGPAWVLVTAGAVALWRRGERGAVLGLAVLGVSVWSQLFVAIDTSRLLALVFPAMLVALEALFRDGSLRVREWAPWVVLVQALAPPTQAVANLYFAMDSLVATLLWK
ncbi:MAG TPA: hypothetical protein VMW19_11270 [Myxococcota bacterium]|nr:hypothetical protein [Myxococcota bacterium]